MSNVQFNTNSPHHCKECGLYLNSAESLEVHLQYHKENLLNKWATQATHGEEANNNNKVIKREFTTVASADSSDGVMKKSPATPESIFGHPPTPQSYHSASSPYQTPENSAYSPGGYQNFVKQERASPNYYQGYQEGFYENQGYMQNFRYHPYQQQYDRNQVSSSSPAYPPQPTPSPSPKQCDKCGYVCESATQLIEHLNVAHPPTPHVSNYQNHFIFGQEIKTEEDAQSEILDLDSHKVVHPAVYEDTKDREHNPHSVSAMLSWPQQQQQQQQQRMFEPQQQQQQQQQQKLFQPQHQVEYNVSTTTEQAPYRPFEHLPQPAPIISSTQVPVQPPTPSTKSTNWKSNEARRPKTYNCTACNKWFTSSGHLKRHYNTTLHKNAVKSSGQPDPATLPISAHHHPAREASTSREEQSNSPTEDSRSEDGFLGHQQHLLQSPPNGEAGPSATNHHQDSRGLLIQQQQQQQHHQHQQQHGFNIPGPMMAANNMDQQFQMYPNECAPHVTQVTVTSSHSTTGEYYATIVPQQQQLDERNESQPLPSFAQFNSRFGLLLGYNGANVGGPGPATAPYSYYEDTPTLPYQDEENYTPPEAQEDEVFLHQPPPSPEKAHIKRDYEETTPTGSPQITSTTIQLQKTNLHKCYDCDKVFNKSCYLTQHNKTFHNGDKPFKCTKCGKRFSGDDQYQEHLSKHAGDKPHKCDLCPKQFNHKTDLRRHMCLHTGQKPYACDTCGKGFIRKDHMLKHCETHTKKPSKLQPRLQIKQELK